MHRLTVVRRRGGVVCARLPAVASHARQQIGHCRQWSVKVRYGHQRQKQGGDPEYTVVREESRQRQNRDDLELQLVGVLVSHVLRQGVQSEIDAAKRNDHHNEKNGSTVQEDIQLSRRGYERRQMVRSCGLIPVAICALLAMPLRGFPLKFVGFGEAMPRCPESPSFR